MEDQDRKDEWDAILPPGLRKTNYGSWSVTKFLEQSPEDRSAYIKKYWDDVEERVAVRDLFKDQGMDFCFYDLTQVVFYIVLIFSSSTSCCLWTRRNWCVAFTFYQRTLHFFFRLIVR